MRGEVAEWGGVGGRVGVGVSDSQSRGQQRPADKVAPPPSP